MKGCGGGAVVMIVSSEMYGVEGIERKKMM